MEKWEQSVPADLVTAIKHVRKTFHDAHWGCGWTTQNVCYALMHDISLDDQNKKFGKYLLRMQANIGPAAASRFRDLVAENTHPALFKAFYDLYADSMTVQALAAFGEFSQIGFANQVHLGISHLAWAEAWTLDLIRSERHVITNWVKNVCDKQTYDAEADDDELVFWKSWRAPMLILMKPSLHTSYEAARIWERKDAEVSSKLLKHFEEDFLLHLEVGLERAVGHAAVELAKHPPAAQAVRPEDSPSKVQVGIMPRNVRLEARKLKTIALYKSWARAYRDIKKRRQGMSDVWYADHIAKLPVGKGRNSSTIRKHMK